MDFELSQDHKVLQSSVRDFVEKEIKPIAIQIDEMHHIPEQLVLKMREMGLLGSYLPEAYSGAGLDILSYAIVVEEVSKACASSGVLISAHTSLACDPILQFGTEEQKKKFLPPLASGEKIGCFLLTEPEAGSDVAGLATTYQKDSDGYVINGNKIFVTNGGYLGTGIVFASMDRSLKHKGISAFIVDLESEGVEILRNENKLGIRGSYTTSFALNNLRVPMENLLGSEGQGFKIAMETLNGGRIGIAAQALGIAEGAFERALAYSKERKQFGHPISELQAIQFKLADMYTRIETSKLIVYRSAWLKENKKPYAADSAMSKLHASETATYVTKEAIQIHGGYGYVTEYEVERMYRDAKITEIYEGTSEVQRLIISRMLLS
ncbi:MAG: acyl-CoA dehydrogenase [Chloroflexi bacterium]|jgi:butyryl-CoA dehydrogenase|nr:acyl-CoA dehydrogenase [Chloroflexota bacterium]